MLTLHHLSQDFPRLRHSIFMSFSRILALLFSPPLTLASPVIPFPLPFPLPFRRLFPTLLPACLYLLPTPLLRPSPASPLPSPHPLETICYLVSVSSPSFPLSFTPPPLPCYSCLPPSFPPSLPFYFPLRAFLSISPPSFISSPHSLSILLLLFPSLPPCYPFSCLP